MYLSFETLVKFMNSPFPNEKADIIAHYLPAGLRIGTGSSQNSILYSMTTNLLYQSYKLLTVIQQEEIDDMDNWEVFNNADVSKYFSQLKLIVNSKPLCN